MAEFIYFFKKDDLYIIGMTRNLDKTNSILKPTKVIASIKTENPNLLITEIEERFKDKQLPTTNYYKLSRNDVIECSGLIDSISSRKNYGPFFSGFNLVITFITAWLIISSFIIKFGVNIIFKNFLDF